MKKLLTYILPSCILMLILASVTYSSTNDEFKDSYRKKNRETLYRESSEKDKEPDLDEKKLLQEINSHVDKYTYGKNFFSSLIGYFYTDNEGHRLQAE